MVCAINGFPPIGRMFLRGIPFEPPRAGMRAMISLDIAQLHRLTGPQRLMRGHRHAQAADRFAQIDNRALVTANASEKMTHLVHEHIVAFEPLEAVDTRL